MTVSPSATLDKGLLITFEGPDGAGKSTIAKGCETILREGGISPVGLFREPGDSEAGRRIRLLSRSGRDAISVEQEIALFLEDRRWDLETNIRPVMDKRGVVLLDRYYHSSIAYQGARGADPDDVRRRNEAFAPPPDLIILMRLDVSECLTRIRRARGERPDLFEERASLERVCELFESMPDPQIQRFDATQPLDAVQREVNAAVLELVERHREN
jgi:dTMP kinase